MPVCDLASIMMDDSSIGYFGAGGAEWRAPLERICAVGELHVQREDGHYLVLLVDATGLWLQAPMHAAGMDRVIEGLSQYLQHPLQLSATQAPSDSSRVLWPVSLAGERMFEPDAHGHLQVSARVLSRCQS